MICYKAYVVFDQSNMDGWWKAPRWGTGYKTIKGLIKAFYRPLSDYGLVEIWRFHEGTPSRDGGVPWFVPELVETYVKGVKQ
jgi:hypothetical protein